MTEFEFIYLLKEIEATMWMHIMNFVTIIFAMLVTAYFIGPRLSRLMTWALLSLFTLGSALFIGSATTSRQDVVTLASTARTTLLAEDSRAPSLNLFNAPAYEIVAMDLMLYGILALAYLATLVFFLQARKQGPASLKIDLD